MAVSDSPYGKQQYSAGFYERQKQKQGTDPAALERKVSQYDLQRRKVEAQGTADVLASKKQAAAGALERGFGKGSGIMEGQQRSAEIEAKRQMGSRLGEVDIQEAKAKEAQAEAERQRQYGTSERVAGQEFSSQEATKGRTFLGGENQKGRQAVIDTETRKAQSEAAYNLGVSGGAADPSWSAAQKASFEAGKSGATKEDADREYEKQYAIETENRATSNTMKLTEQNFINNQSLATLNSDLAMGQLNLQNTFAMDKETRTAQSTAAYQTGLSGGTADPNWTPAQLASYQAGKGGKTIEDANRAYDEQITKRNARLMALNPEDFAGKQNELMATIDSILSGKYIPTVRPAVAPAQSSGTQQSALDAEKATGGSWG